MLGEIPCDECSGIVVISTVNPLIKHHLRFVMYGQGLTNILTPFPRATGVLNCLSMPKAPTVIVQGATLSTVDIMPSFSAAMHTNEDALFHCMEGTD